MNIGLYLHIPFCRQKCYYCDFPSYADYEQYYVGYVDALCREIAIQGSLYSRQDVDSVYIGGGTPTVLSNNMLAAIIESIYKNFRLTSAVEFSVEANPGTADYSKLKLLRGMNVNRISFGVQAFQDRLLTAIGRIHRQKHIYESIEWAKRAGFDNINIDLMYGLPGQKIAEWKESLDIFLNRDICHISVYGLKIEEGTVFFQLQQTGQLELPSEENDEAMYEYVNCLLPDAGYRRYEISNYAKAGCECRHNLKYWRYQPYVGIGAAACTFINNERRTNTTDVIKYIEQINHRQSAVEFVERIASDNAMAEYLFLGLRTNEGIDLADFQNRFNEDFMQRYGSIFNKMKKIGLLMQLDNRILLTYQGIKYGNVVFRSFLPN